MTDIEQKRIKAICKVAHVDDISDLSDGYHTFKQLYYQRMILFATLVKQNRDKAWKSLRHEDGELCFGGGWFIVGIDTPDGSYTYHYEDNYFSLFDCVELERGKRWDGHTEKDVTRLLSLEQEPCDELDFVQPHKKVSVNLEICKMREATQEECEGIDQYIDNIAEPCEDAISRQAVLDCLTATKLKKFDFILNARAEIKKLPSVNTQPKTGYWFEWKPEDDVWRTTCSECGEETRTLWNYCPNCGAKMAELQKSEVKEWV